MIGRVVDWLGRRHALIHRTDEVARRAEIRLQRAERVVAEDRRQGAHPGVNFLYDRLTGREEDRHAEHPA